MGGGIERLEDSVRPTGSLIPPGCTWYQTSVGEFKPDQNLVVTADGQEVQIECNFVYRGLSPMIFFGIWNFLVLISGLEIFLSKIRGRFGIESMLWRWEAKNNPQDYRITQSFGSGLLD